MKMKTLSIVLNVVLLIGLVIVYFNRSVEQHFYAEFTGMVLQESARQIEAGKSARVAEILKENRGRPTYAELVAMLQRLQAHEVPLAKQAGTEHPGDVPAR
ncbi:hypothetical protein [Luteolibacter sp. LG18]|uniref:hypothetical protein n=1 Tax=Luteolibacter sp. LG18 TaxID=2819286 RepID=UPI002B282677|nr:hypothetical protein llg_38050 [Luteolibacter sp. LG18]